ncbi:MAG: dATP pyrophosphohydrolase [Stellaceae bacterium]
MTDIEIVPAESPRDLRRFIALPHRIYANDPHWVPPLDSEVNKLLSRKKNPFFHHGDAAYWLALRGGEPVGRISAQINRLHLERYNDATGNFGFLEAFDDQAIFDRLFATAEDWLRGRGMRRSLGPYSPTVNDDIGVLVSGFDTPPMALMGHAPRYYRPRLEKAGYAKAKDVFAYRIERENLNFDTVGRLKKIAERATKGTDISLRQIDMKRFEEEMRLALDLYNDAWHDNWGFISVAPDEVTAVIAAIKPVIRADLVIMASIRGAMVGFTAAIPNINEYFVDLKGKLLPFGWAKLLWRLRYGKPRGVRVILGGVKSEYRNSVLGAAVMSSMLALLVENLIASSYQVCEISWILEDNKASLGITRAFAKLAKIYRIYQKELAPPP